MESMKRLILILTTPVWIPLLAVTLPVFAISGSICMALLGTIEWLWERKWNQ